MSQEYINQLQSQILALTNELDQLRNQLSESPEEPSEDEGRRRPASIAPTGGSEQEILDDLREKALQQEKIIELEFQAHSLLDQIAAEQLFNS